MRTLLVALLVLAVLAVAGDRVAAGLAEGELEQRALAEAGTAVSADIRGFPFLTQALARELDHVVLTADRYRVPAGLEVLDLDADVRSVDLRDSSRPVAGRVRLDGVLPFAEVERRVGLARGSLVGLGDDRVRVSRRVRVGGAVAEVTGDARVRVERGALVVAPTAVTVAGGAANGALIRELGPRLSLRYPVRACPPVRRSRRSASRPPASACASSPTTSSSSAERRGGRELPALPRRGLNRSEAAAVAPGVGTAPAAGRGAGACALRRARRARSWATCCG
jgi:hypothetical protein